MINEESIDLSKERAITALTCKKTNKTIFQVYINIRSKEDQSFRVQRKKKCKSLQEARRERNTLERLAFRLIAEHEAKGNCWRKVIKAFEAEALSLGVNPLTGKPVSLKTVKNYVSMLEDWTEDWLLQPAKEISRTEGRRLLKRAKESDMSLSHIRKLKGVINNVFDFGIQDGIIKDVSRSPVWGLSIDVEANDKLPEILRVNEVQALLNEAYGHRHRWADIWAVALMTGMRSSELFALRKENVLIEEEIIRISESWDWENDCAKSTKARYWRNAPIAGALRPIIEKLMKKKPDCPYLLPRLKEWEEGYQALVLRSFCEQIGITSVRFHTLRACFATHLLASGVDDATVMRIGGWRDFKAFQIYVRLAGVNEKGATNGLGKIFLIDPDKKAPETKQLIERVADVYSGGPPLVA